MNRHVFAIIMAIVAIIGGRVGQIMNFDMWWLAYSCGGVLLFLEAANWIMDRSQK